MKEMAVQDAASGGGDLSSASLPCADKLAIQYLIFEHWARTDRVVEALASELYLPDGEMRIGKLVKVGTSEIDAYFAERRAQEDDTARRTRHVISNLVVDGFNGDSATARFLGTVFAGTGQPPFATGAPTTIADFTAECRRNSEGNWRIQTMLAKVMFTGAGAANFAR